MSAYRAVNLAIAFLLELAAVAALCLWGLHISDSTPVHVVLAIALPAIGIILWALFAAAAKPRFAVPAWFKILIKTLVYASAAVGLYLSGQHVLAIVFTGLLIVNTTLIRIGHLDEGIAARR